MPQGLSLRQAVRYNHWSDRGRRIVPGWKRPPPPRRRRTSTLA